MSPAKATREAAAIAVPAQSAEQEANMAASGLGASCRAWSVTTTAMAKVSRKVSAVLRPTANGRSRDGRGLSGARRRAVCGPMKAYMHRAAPDRSCRKTIGNVPKARSQICVCLRLAYTLATAYRTGEA